MAEFDEKLNSLLSNPDAMAQIMQLAQSLGGGQEMLKSSQTEASPFAEVPHPNPSVSYEEKNFDPIASLLGDPSLLLKLMPLIRELKGDRDSNARTLLYALRPYLKSERQEKVERALQLARLFYIGKKFLMERE